MNTDIKTQEVKAPKSHKKATLVVLLTLAALVLAGIGGFALAKNVSGEDNFKAGAYEQGLKAGLEEAAEKRKAVLVVKEVEGNTQVDIGEYLNDCSENAEGICVDDFDSVDVCVLENGSTACGVYTTEQWASHTAIIEVTEDGFITERSIRKS